MADISAPSNHSSNVDILIGALDENLQTKQYFNASRHYYYDSLTWFVQKRKRIPVWQNILHLCRDPYVYIGAVTTIICGCFLVYFLQQFDPNRNWDFNRVLVIGISTVIFGQAAFKANTIALRLFLTSVYFGSIIYTTATSSILILMITSPFLNPQITSISEIIDGHFNLVGNQFAFNKVSDQNEVS